MIEELSEFLDHRTNPSINFIKEVIIKICIVQIIDSNILTSGSFFPFLAYSHSFGLLFLVILVYVKLKYFLLEWVLIVFGSLASGGVLMVWIHFLDALFGKGVGCHWEDVSVALLVFLGVDGFLFLGRAWGVVSRGDAVTRDFL